MFDWNDTKVIKALIVPFNIIVPPPPTHTHSNGVEIYFLPFN